MCDVCHSSPCDPRCPNATTRASSHGGMCTICADHIYENEEYLDNGTELVHFECVPSIRWLLEWLGHDIKTFYENEEYDSDYYDDYDDYYDDHDDYYDDLSYEDRYNYQNNYDDDYYDDVDYDCNEDYDD